MHRSRLLLAVSASSAFCASAATAQEPAVKIPVKQLGAAQARSAEPVGTITTLRALSDGTLLLNDFPQRRVVMFDGSLKQVKIVADTLSAPIPYGQRQQGLMPFTGDSSILVDPATLAMLVLNPRGEVARVMSVPRPQDINSIASAQFGTNAFDSKGQLIYRGQAGFGGGMNFGMGGGNPGGGRGGNGGPGGQGGPGGGGQGGAQGGRGGQGGAGGGGRGGFGDDFGGGGGGQFGGGNNGQGGRGGPGGGRGGANTNPDSLPILRSNFDTRKTDTVTFVRVPKNEFATQPTPEGGTRVITKINPLPQADDWALLSDGTVAVVRVLDYHVDWYTPDGKHAASPKLPFDWKQLKDEEKAKIIDSLKAAADVYTKQMAAQMGNNGNANRIAFEPVAAERLPDFYPPIRQGTTHADADGNMWILPATSSISANDFINAAAGGRGGRGGDGGRGGFGGGGDNGGRGGPPGAAGAGGPPGGAGAAGAGAGAAGAGAAGGDRAGRGAGGGGRGGLDALLPPQPVVSLNYDVVNRKGELVERVQLPAGRTIAGFGPKGVIYLAVREGRNVFLEKYTRN